MNAIVTAIDINTARKAGQSSIVVADKAVITPQAIDNARDYGISIIRNSATMANEQVNANKKAVIAKNNNTNTKNKTDLDALATEVKRLVTGKVGTAIDPAKLEKAVCAVLGLINDKAEQTTFIKQQNGIAHVKLAELPKTVPDGLQESKDAVQMLEALAPTDTAPCVGYLSFENSSFSFTFNQTQILIVLAGELQLTSENVTFKAVHGDTLRIDAGSPVKLTAVGKVFCVYSSN